MVWWHRKVLNRNGWGMACLLSSIRGNVRGFRRITGVFINALLPHTFSNLLSLCDLVAIEPP